MLAARVRFLSSLLGLGAFCLLVASGLSAYAQRPGGGGPGGFGGFAGGAALLRNPDVVKELELTDDQNEQIKVVGDKVGEEIRALFQRGGGGGGNREENAEKVRALTADSQKQIDKILLPHQAKRFKQLEFQQSMSFRGVTGSLTSDAAVKALDITDDQKDALTTKAKEVDQELRKKTAKLRQEAQQKMLDSLTAEQRAKWKELAGEPFDFGAGGGFGGFAGFGAGGAGGRPGGGGAGGRPAARPE